MVVKPLTFAALTGVMMFMSAAAQAQTQCPSVKAAIEALKNGAQIGGSPKTFRVGPSNSPTAQDMAGTASEESGATGSPSKPVGPDPTWWPCIPTVSNNIKAIEKAELALAQLGDPNNMKPEFYAKRKTELEQNVADAKKKYDAEYVTWIKWSNLLPAGDKEKYITYDTYIKNNHPDMANSAANSLIAPPPQTSAAPVAPQPSPAVGAQGTQPTTHVQPAIPNSAPIVGSAATANSPQLDAAGAAKHSPEKLAGLSKHVLRADKDGDGAISLAEFLAPLEKGFDRLDKNKDGKIAADEVGQRHTKLIGKYDKDGDQAVSLEEFVALAKERFAKSDADGNGKLEVAELIALAPKRA